jgi:hypothetical protein
MIADFIVRLKNGSLEFFNDRNNPFGEPFVDTSLSAGQG